MNPKFNATVITSGIRLISPAKSDLINSATIAHTATMLVPRLVAWLATRRLRREMETWAMPTSCARMPWALKFSSR